MQREEYYIRSRNVVFAVKRVFIDYGNAAVRKNVFPAAYPRCSASVCVKYKFGMVVEMLGYTVLLAAGKTGFVQ